jgi:predicted dienelactone hydrolase
MARNFGYATGELNWLDKVVAHGVEGAPPARSTAFPILIFSHGYECYPAQNTALLEQLASHGYIAISVAHPHDAADLRLANGRLLETSHPAGTDPEFAALRKQLSSGPNHEVRTAALERYPQALSRDRLGASLTAWRDDLLFLTRAIEARNLTPELQSVLATGDTGRLGFMGMSFGGAAAASSCKHVKQCHAVINLDGGNYDPDLFDAAVGRPLLLLMSDWVHLPLPGRPSDPEFSLNDYAYEPWSKAGLDPDIIRLRLDGIRHMGFTDLILLMDGPEHEGRFGTIPPEIAVEAIASTSLAFLNHYLKKGSRETLDRAIRDRPVLQVHSPESVRRWAEARQRHAR